MNKSFTAIMLSLFAVACGSRGVEESALQGASDGPGITVNPHPHQRGDAAAGKDVFRFETFGNEGFWTDAMRCRRDAGQEDPPKQMLDARLQLDIEAVPPAMRASIEAEAKTDLSIQSAPVLNDPATTGALINANAVVGMVAKDSNGDQRIDIMAGDRSVWPALSATPSPTKSVYDLPGGGSMKAGAAGLQLANDYESILKATGVTGFPYVRATMTGAIAPSSPVGRRVDNQKLLDMNAYLDALPAPKGAVVNAELASRGRELREPRSIRRWWRDLFNASSI